MASAETSAERSRTSRERTTSRVLLIGALVVLGILGLTPRVVSVIWNVLPACLALALVVGGARNPSPSWGAAVLVLGLSVALGFGALWQLAMPLALVGLAAFAHFVPASQGPRVERGKVPLALTLFAGFVTPGALVAWVHFLDPDLSDLSTIIPAQPFWVLVLGGAVFSVLNATFEEWVWRGILQPRLAAEWGVRWAIGLQAASFGVAHAYGFPRGPVGVLLAGSWAVILGVLRHRAGGLLAPILAHIVADATIAIIILGLAPL